MINFQELEIVVNDKYSFVGIEKRNSKLLFRLPKGFDRENALTDTFEKKRDLFFKLYKILNKFKEICIEKGYLENDTEIKIQERDGVIKSNQGSKIKSADDENIFYSKLDLIGSLLKAYNEPQILAFVYRLGRAENFDLSQMHRFLHKAIFLDNGTAYIDYMDLPRKEIHFEATDIVSMYCYLVSEIKQQLHEEVTSEVKALAERFRQKYIGSESSLFHEKYYCQVLNTLKDALEVIDRNTQLKDSDYWHFYDAIELFLLGDLDRSDEGEIWGIKNFHAVWESICLTYLVKNIEPKCLLYLDKKFISNEILKLANSKANIIDLSSAFKLNGSELIPDAVIIPHFGSLRKKQNGYQITKDTWNDYDYLTSFYCKLTSLPRLKIAYVGQVTGNHTFDELKKNYSVQNNTLIIDSPLPKNFYSFWDINWSDEEEIFLEQIEIMSRFNHIFYIAFLQGFFSFEEFKTDILAPLEVGQFNKDNVFIKSIFRGSSLTKISQEFNDFIQGLFKRFFLEIVDVKYSTFSYYLDSQNIEEIKNRNIRKQFVYEYLLQKFIQRSSNLLFSKLSIRSSFWLPTYLADSKIFEIGPKYLDGYITLKGVNVTAIFDSYLD